MAWPGGIGMTRFLYLAGVLSFSFVVGVSTAYAWPARVVGVPDGDSLKVERQGKTYKVRLYGIDSPEYGQEDFRPARDYTRTRVSGRTVEITVKDKDRYGRIVALVERDGQLINRELVARGLAWMYPRYCTTEPLCHEMEALQQSAKDQRLGLWQGARPLPPRKWKQQNGSSYNYRNSR